MAARAAAADGGKKKHRWLARVCRFYPGIINAEQLSKEEIEGLILNMGSLEAMEDVRFIMSLGATFGGKDSRPYIDALFGMAWDNAETRRAAIEMMDAADAKRGMPRNETGGR